MKSLHDIIINKNEIKFNIVLRERCEHEHRHSYIEKALAKPQHILVKKPALG